MAKKFAYTGHDNLESMAHAVNYNNFLIKHVIDEIGEKNLKNKKVLDFGAGSGTYADMLLKQGIKVDCIEPDTKLQKTLRSKGHKVLSSVSEIRPHSYDIIYAFNVMEHIENDHEIFDRLTRALRHEGSIVIYVPAFHSIFSAMDTLVGHHRRYRKNRLREMAQRNKLNITRLEYVDAIGYVASLAFKLTGNKKGTISPRSVKLYDRLAFPLSKSLGHITKHVFGKNALLIAKKPAAQ